MKRRHTGYIFAAVFVSLCSFLLHIVSVTTDHWVEGEAVLATSIYNVTHINYGLFSGTVVRSLSDSSKKKSALFLVCLPKENVCAWTCQTSDSLRREEVSTLYDTGQISFGCTDVSENVQDQVEPPARGPFRPLSEVRASFVNGIAWLATVASVSVSQFINLVALLISAYNTNNIPSNGWVAIRSLYFWYGATGIFAMLTLSVWGTEFFFKLKQNAGIVDTIAGVLNSSGQTNLGYSFWSLVGVVGLQCCCVGLLYYRENLFGRRPLFILPLEIQQNTIETLRYS